MGAVDFFYFQNGRGNLYGVCCRRRSRFLLHKRLKIVDMFLEWFSFQIPSLWVISSFLRKAQCLPQILHSCTVGGMDKRNRLMTYILYGVFEPCCCGLQEL